VKDDLSALLRPNAAWVLPAVAIALRLTGLTTRSLWFDEANTLAVTAAPLSGLPSLVRSLEGFPPLHYLLLRAWLPFWGDPLLGMRAFSLVCGLGALAAFWPLCRRLAPVNARAAFFLACASSFWIHLSQDGRPYSLFLLLGLVTSNLLLDLEARWSWTRGAAWAGCCAAGIYTHNFFVLLLAAHAAYLLLRLRRQPARLLGFMAALGLAAAAYAPWLASLLIQVQNWAAVSSLSAPLDFNQLTLLLGAMVIDTGFLGLAHPGLTRVFGGAALLCGAAVAYRRRGDWRPEHTFVFFHLIALFVCAKILEIALGRPVTQARYLVMVSPFLFLCLAQLFEFSPVLAKASLPTVFFAGTLAYQAAGIFLDPRLEKMAAAIRKSSPPRMAVVHLDAYYYTPLRFYYLPERAHFLLEPGNRNLNWPALPGYAADPGIERIARLGPCVAVDPQRWWFPQRLGLATGGQLAYAAVKPAKP
jgi:uncharacterized membrane protein